MAQPGSASAWGAGGRWFESSPPDKWLSNEPFFMKYYVYILQSEVSLKYYCGQTDNIEFRLNRHNNKEVKSTKHAAPWKLIGYIVCNSRSESMNLEKEIKSRGIERWLQKNHGLLIIS